VEKVNKNLGIEHACEGIEPRRVEIWRIIVANEKTSLV